jgi:rubredoxin
MKCDQCGQQFDGSQATTIQVYEKHEGGGSYSMTICPACEAKRDEVATILAWGAVVFAACTLVAFAAIVAAINLL